MNTDRIHSIHCYGDSLTAGYGAAPGEGWISRLARDFPSVQFYNHGECGWGLADILSLAGTMLHAPAPGEALFLMGGTNDLFAGIQLTALEKLSEREIPRLADRIPLCLGIPILPTRRAIAAGWLSEWNFDHTVSDLRQYGDFLRHLAAIHAIPVLDFQKDFPYDDTFYDDGTHPNRKGYALFAAIAETVLPLPKR